MPREETAGKAMSCPCLALGRQAAEKAAGAQVCLEDFLKHREILQYVRACVSDGHAVNVTWVQEVSGNSNRPSSSTALVSINTPGIRLSQSAWLFFHTQISKA